MGTFMDFSWPREQKELHDRVFDFAVQKPNDTVQECDRAAFQAGLDRTRIYRALRIIPETGVERGLRDCVSSTICSGASEIPPGLIARSLGL